MIRPGEIIAQRRRRVGTKKYRAGVADLLRQLCVGCLTINSTCSGAIALANSIISLSLRATMIAPYFSSDLSVIACRLVLRKLVVDRAAEFSQRSPLKSSHTAPPPAHRVPPGIACPRRRGPDRLNHPPRVRISLGPAIESIFTSPKTMRLAVATKIFPGPTILSTFGNRLRAESQRSHSLRAADAKNAVHPGHMRRSENDRAVIADRRGHNDFFNTRHFGGNCVHQNSRGIGCFAARNIHANPFQRRDALAEYHPERIAILPAFCS